MKLVTDKELLEAFSDNVYEGVKHAQSFYPEYPTKPQKPILKNNHTVPDVELYQQKLSTYEKQLSEYNAQKSTYQEISGKVNEAIENYIKELSGFNRLVPDDKKGKVWWKAWEDGHSSGYSEVYGCLRNLVELFE